MDNQFTQRVSEILLFSKEESDRLGNNYVGTGHLLLGIIREGDNKAVSILQSLYVDLKKLKLILEDELRGQVASPVRENFFGSDKDLDKKASKVMKLSILEAKLLKSPEVDTEHVLLAIMKDNENKAAEILESQEVTYRKVMDRLVPHKEEPKDGLDFGEEDEDEDDGIRRRRPDEGNMSYRSEGQPVAGTKQQKSSKDTPVLDSFSTDMTKAAEEGKLDPVVGREKEIERLAQILSRRKKNNPILIGEPGVGKSAIVEGLAMRIVERKVSRILFDKRVVALDMTAVVAGTKYRGQFEERIRSILNELKKNPDIILFIDEIHNIVGAGSAAGSMDAANILKPSLARGEIQCIGATTLDEYRQNIEKDGALERRFQKVMVEPTTPEETLQILKNIKEKYEEHHCVNYTDEALEACVKLTDRYISDRNFPDKAIDALDEAGSRVHLTNVSVPKEIEEQEKLIEEARKHKNEAVNLQNFELAASFRDQEKNYMNQLEVMKREWEENLKQQRETVDAPQIENVVSMMSGVPVQRMAQAEGIRLKGMKEELKSRVIAQDKAVDTLVKAIQRSRVGLKDPNKPIGTFLFLGPTGVGKTHLAKELARQLFGTTDAMIRIDMSEYMEKYSVSRLIGAPPGYVGYEEGGQLTEKVRRNPYSIVLFDEIEKANPEVFNLLLQVLDEGRLTDSQGRLVDFKNTVIIMTSNLGSESILEGHREEVETLLHHTFKPEFLNRIDEIVYFNPLSKDTQLLIVEKMLSELQKRLQEQYFTVSFTKGLEHYILDSAYSPEFGARPLKRFIQDKVETVLATAIIDGSMSTKKTYVVDWRDNKIRIDEA